VFPATEVQVALAMMFDEETDGRDIESSTESEVGIRCT